MTGRAERVQPADRGSASIWLLGLIALVLAVTLTVLVQSAAILGRHRLQRSADLAALAAAGRIGLDGDPCQAARRIATANRAVLDRCVTSLDPSGRSGTVAVWISGRVGLPLLGPRSLHGRARAGRLRGPGQPRSVPLAGDAVLVGIPGGVEVVHRRAYNEVPHRGGAGPGVVDRPG